MRHPTRFVLAVLITTLAACDDAAPAVDASVPRDSGPHVELDATPDAPPDAAVDASPRAAVQAAYDASLAAWPAIRDALGNSYAYVRETSSCCPLPEVTDETTVVVAAGVVTERRWRRLDSKSEVVDSWEELGAEQIGSHDDGFPASTMDELYVECADAVLDNFDAAAPDVVFTFLAFDDGPLRICAAFNFAKEVDLGSIQLASFSAR